jgi:cation diffusion facilitator CzcD-associated flavoprotein CzcO
MGKNVNLLVIGAGPFGLAMAAYAQHLGIGYMIVGKPMEFWKANMPKGMYLRSASDWDLDSLNVHTIEKFLDTQSLTLADVEPLSLQFYLAYTQWFQEQKRIDAVRVYVRRLDDVNGDENRFQAMTDDGQTIVAKHVVLAVGFKYFKHMPPELVKRLPPGRFSHTCDLVDFKSLKGKRCLILGGRQSAFEWAASINEDGAAAVHVAYRHDTPAFEAADWSWVSPLVGAMVDNPGWFRTLSPDDKETVSHRLWAEGRLKVQPWLESRLKAPTIRLWPMTQLVACAELPNRDLSVQLDNGETITVDHIILATGYKVKIEQVPFLAGGNLLDRLATRNGFPILDEHFQTNLPGLFITSIPAIQDFGPFFGFTVSVRTSAALIGRAIAC